jgi:ATP-binding cassette, subfamily B, bacterial HlyB/CyaB
MAMMGEENQGEQAAKMADSLLRALVVVARKHNVQLSATELVENYHLEPGQPSVDQLAKIATDCGLRVTRQRFSWQDLMRLGEAALPAIVVLRNGYAMVLSEIGEGPHFSRVVLKDPNAHDEAPLVLDEARFTGAWSGEILLLSRHYRLTDPDQPFSFRLIFGLILRDRRFTTAIFASAFMISVLALAPIMFWRLLVDRVLYAGSLDTLAALCLIMLGLIGFETAFTALRRFLSVKLTLRLDAQLWTLVFNKMITLPVDYFERTPKGETLRSMFEVQRLRNFLTTGLFGPILDSFVLFVFLPIMFFFSPILTFCVMALASVIVLWILFRLPDVRRKTGAVVAAEVEKNTFLIEMLHGIRTVKAMALDARCRHDWDVKSAKSARLRFDEGRTTNAVITVVTPIERLMVYGVIVFAMYLAMVSHRQIFPGALFAFMMLSQRMAAPLVGLAQMITQYDEAWLAVGFVAELMNRPSEEGHGKDAIRRPLAGLIEFSGVRFRYPGTPVPALDDVSFTIPEGTVLGVMGRSGSGKTTVTRLLQLFHANYEGLITIDGIDLRKYDVTHLRSSFGVVSQENFLFSGTIRQTIAAGKPDATFDEVVMAARLAGAEEFIERLPRGYETYIYEGSSNLSGGQRQRLAIARALITNPRILILDEATSALDAESEAIVNANLSRIAEGRTMVVVSHRLSSLVNADAILVLERGRVYDIGTHAELVERCDIYSNLWHQQHQHLMPRPSHEVVTFQPAKA